MLDLFNLFLILFFMLNHSWNSSLICWPKNLCQLFCAPGAKNPRVNPSCHHFTQRQTSTPNGPAQVMAKAQAATCLQFGGPPTTQKKVVNHPKVATAMWTFGGFFGGVRHPEMYRNTTPAKGGWITTGGNIDSLGWKACHHTQSSTISLPWREGLVPFRWPTTLSYKLPVLAWIVVERWITMCQLPTCFFVHHHEISQIYL